MKVVLLFDFASDAPGSDDSKPIAELPENLAHEPVTGSIRAAAPPARFGAKSDVEAALPAAFEPGRERIRRVKAVASGQNDGANVTVARQTVPDRKPGSG